MSPVGGGWVQGTREANCSTPASESEAKLELQTGSHSSPMLPESLQFHLEGGSMLTDGRRQSPSEPLGKTRKGRSSHH